MKTSAASLQMYCCIGDNLFFDFPYIQTQGAYV
jgi:hypothetical protein